MIYSARLLKEKAREIARVNNVTVQEVLQNYMIERILFRLSMSKYKNNFILKGGLLISSMSGIQSRTTMDMDTLIKGINLERTELLRILNEILLIDVQDNVKYEITEVVDIREDDAYGGLRFKIIGVLENIRNSLSIDVSTGDVLTPNEMDFLYQTIFENECISIKSYNLETILAEKFQTIIEKNGAKGRMKDFYDVWYFINNHMEDIDFKLLKLALHNTSSSRNCLSDLERVDEILVSISNSLILKRRWNEYARKHQYTEKVSYENTIDALKSLSVYIV